MVTTYARKLLLRSLSFFSFFFILSLSSLITKTTADYAEIGRVDILEAGFQQVQMYRMFSEFYRETSVINQESTVFFLAKHSKLFYVDSTGQLNL